MRDVRIEADEIQSPADGLLDQLKQGRLGERIQELCIDVDILANHACVRARLLAGSTTADTGEARAVLARGGGVLLVASGGTVTTTVLAAVTTVAVTTGSAVGAIAATSRRTSRASGTLVRSRHNLGGQVQELTQVLNTLVSKRVEVPLPRELRVHVTARGERLKSLDNLEVRDLELRVLNSEVLGGDHNTLLEERGVDRLAVLLADDHFEGVVNWIQRKGAIVWMFER